MILVTGGAGFIGSAIVWGLNQDGTDNIVVTDHLGLGDKWKNLARAHIDFAVPKESFAQWLKDNPKEITAVFHLGACSATTERNADYLMDNNVLFTKQLWDYCAQHSIPFLYASSAATYGAEEENFSDVHSHIPNLVPINKYGWSKQIFDAWAIKQKKTPPAWFGFKFFNVYGPQEYHKGAQASVVYHAFPQARDNGQLKLFKSYRDGIGHGEQQRDFVYVKDIVRIMLHFWKNSAHVPSGVYNLGTGQARSFKDLGSAVFQAMGKTPRFEWIEMPDSLKGQYQYFTEANLQKLRDRAGYTADFHSLEDGVLDYVRNYLMQEQPYLF
ncbi:MAG: ADP-glyceromanno-heptose 6-epimerase [Chitinophagaceae bacterium]|nr:ADP-glyceromanno-heptose 6-epimerase [Oligoflexus sp.]